MCKPLNRPKGAAGGKLTKQVWQRQELARGGKMCIQSFGCAVESLLCPAQCQLCTLQGMPEGSSQASPDCLAKRLQMVMHSKCSNKEGLLASTTTSCQAMHASPGCCISRPVKCEAAS